MLQLKTGEVDMMIGVQPSDANKLQSTNPEIRIYPTSGRIYYYNGYNQQKDFFKNTEVRKALAMAIDCPKIIQSLLFGFGKQCIGHVPPMLSWAYNDKVDPFPYSPDEAKSLFESLKQ